MAKRKKKGPGRGRRGAPFDPVTGQFLRTKTAPSQPAASTAPAPAAVVIVESPAETVEQVKQEVSGFRKALMQTAGDLGVDRSEIQDALLDGLRKTAEDIVRQNKEIFGEKLEKTVDQSAAYEIFDAVVRLSEEAATAKTVEQKRKILQRLQTYKKVAQNVFAGGGKQAEVARALIDMIEKIEKPLSKETGIKAAAKEKISDYMKMLPEKMAAKIPLVGGMLSRSLQRRRERKEEEAEALATLTEEISKAGRTSLYGRGGGIEIGSSPSSADMTGTEPPIPGGTPVSQLGAVGGRGFNKDAVVTLKAILLNIKEIRDLMFERYDPAKEELEKEESAREEENRKQSFLRKLLSGKSKSGGAAPAAEGEGGGMVSSILKFLGMEGLGTALMSTITSTLTPILASLGAAIGSLAMTIGGAVASAATAVGGAAMVAAPWVAAAGAGTAIGLGAAWLINKGIDEMFGTDLSDRMFEADTWTFGDAMRDAEREEQGRKIAEEQARQTSTPEYIQRVSQDPRMLPKLVSDKKITGTEALSALADYEQKYGPGEDTKAIRERILSIDPTAQDLSAPISPADGSVKGEVVPAGEKNITQQTLNMLEQSQDALAAETMGPPSPVGVNTVVAPTTNNSSTTINNNSGNTGVRNNDPTLKAAERASL